MCRAADNCQESTSSLSVIRSKLDLNGGGAGEGAGDGGAEIVTMKIVIITILPWAAVALGGGSIIDLHPVQARTTKNSLNIQSVNGEGDCLSIG